MLGLELAMFELQLALAPDHLALLFEETRHRTAKFPVDDIVNAGGMLRVEAAQLLETAAGASLETIQAERDRVFDGGVVANVEMEKRMLLVAAPVAPVHGGVIANVESARNKLAIALGQHQAHIRSETAVQFVKKLLGEILPAVVKPGDVPPVELGDGAQMLLGQLFAFAGAHGYAALPPLAPLSLEPVVA